MLVAAYDADMCDVVSGMTECIVIAVDGICLSVFCFRMVVPIYTRYEGGGWTAAISLTWLPLLDRIAGADMQDMVIIEKPNTWVAPYGFQLSTSPGTGMMDVKHVASLDMACYARRARVEHENVP